MSTNPSNGPQFETMLKIVHINEHIEREIVVEIEGRELTCVLSICRYSITVGASYAGSVSLWAAEGLNLEEAGNEAIGITQLDGGFRYRVVGGLRGSVLDTGIEFQDDMFSLDYAYLHGQRVVVEADRIHVELE